jgi:hypothetical protein
VVSLTTKSLQIKYFASAEPTHRTAGLSHKPTTKALQITRIMELGGLEPPTSWVRYKLAERREHIKLQGVSTVLEVDCWRGMRLDHGRFSAIQALLAKSA